MKRLLLSLLLLCGLQQTVVASESSAKEVIKKASRFLKNHSAARNALIFGGVLLHSKYISMPLLDFFDREENGRGMVEVCLSPFFYILLFLRTKNEKILRFVAKTILGLVSTNAFLYFYVIWKSLLQEGAQRELQRAQREWEEAQQETAGPQLPPRQEDAIS